jgi:hypothetical protein
MSFYKNILDTVKDKYSTDELELILLLLEYDKITVVNDLWNDHFKLHDHLDSILEYSIEHNLTRLVRSSIKNGATVTSYGLNTAIEMENETILQLLIQNMQFKHTLSFTFTIDEKYIHIAPEAIQVENRYYLTFSSPIDFCEVIRALYKNNKSEGIQVTVLIQDTDNNRNALLEMLIKWKLFDLIDTFINSVPDYEYKWTVQTCIFNGDIQMLDILFQYNKVAINDELFIDACSTESLRIVRYVILKDTDKKINFTKILNRRSIECCFYIKRFIISLNPTYYKYHIDLFKDKQIKKMIKREYKKYIKRKHALLLVIKTTNLHKYDIWDWNSLQHIFDYL